MANQSPSSLFLDQGQGFWGALKERFPWMTDAEIQALLSQVEGMNPNITDIDTGYQGVPYNVPHIPKPPGYIREYGDPEDVRAYGEQEAGAMRAFLAKSQSARNSALDAEYEKTARVARLARAFGVNVSVPTRRQGARSTADPAKGVAKKSANRKFFEDLMAFSAQVGGRITGDELREFLTDVNAGEDQMKALESSGLWNHLDLGKQIPMYEIVDGELKISWHYKNDAGDIAAQRAAGKVLDKNDATVSRDLEIDKNIVSIVEKARAVNGGAGIRTHEDFKKFRTDNATVLSKDPKILAALKGIIPDALWQRGKMEPLFRKNADGTITVKDFEVGSTEYNTGLSSTTVGGEEIPAEWSKTIEEVLINERQKARELFVEVVNSNKDLEGFALKFKFLEMAKQRGIIGHEKFDLPKLFDDWYDKEDRDKTALDREMSSNLTYIAMPPTAENLPAIRAAVSKTSSKAQENFWKQYADRYPYAATEPRTMYHPETAQPSDPIHSWAERHGWESKGYTSEDKPDIRPAYAKKQEKRHQLISDAIKEAGPTANTYRYYGQELPAADQAAFLERHPSGVSRFTPQGMEDFEIATDKAIETIVGGEGGLNNLNSEIQAIISTARQGGGGQLAFLQRVQRLFDPGGVVREGDVQLMRMLDSWITNLGTTFQRTLGEDRIVSDDLINELEAAAYIYWRVRTDYLRDELKSAEIDYNRRVKPMPYELGGPSGYGMDDVDMGALLGEGVKKSWEQAVGNNVIKLQNRDLFDPYIMMGFAPLLSVGETGEGVYNRMVRGLGSAEEGDATMTGADWAKKWNLNRSGGN